MDENDCPTTPKEKQWEQNVTMVGEYSRIEVAANIVKPEEGVCHHAYSHPWEGMLR